MTASCPSAISIVWLSVSTFTDCLEFWQMLWILSPVLSASISTMAFFLMWTFPREVITEIGLLPLTRIEPEDKYMVSLELCA